jgi:predicted CxxxxCH...CXXCH cytochrome family protein
VTNGSVAEIVLRLPFSTPQGTERPETVSRGSGVNYDGRGYGYSTGTSCDTYCHSDGRGNPGKRNAGTTPRLEWTTGTAVACGDCHNKYGDASPTWSGSHSKHLAGTASTNATCNACHAATAANNTSLIATRRDRHPNGFRNVTGNSIAGPFAFSSVSQQCTNVYCHFSKPVTWGGTLASGCIGCHGYNAASADPINTRGHKAHVNNTSTRFSGFNFRCNECHASTVNAFDNVTAVSLHANRVNEVVWGPKSTGGLAYTTNGCNQIYCHSNGAGVYKAPPTTWSAIADGQQGTIECNYCHNGLAGVQKQMSTGRHINHINAGPLPHRPVACNWCHSNTVASDGQSVFNGTDVKHINRMIDVSFIKMANFSGSYSTSNHVCANTYCHTNNATTSTRDWDTATLNTCGNCHEANNTTTASATLSASHRKHYNTSTRPSNTTEAGWTNANLSSTNNIFMCGTCHPANPTSTHINGPPAGVTNGSVAEIVMRPPFSTPSGAGRPETVFRGSGVNYDGRGYGYSTGTSCDTYCHSDGRGGLGKRNYANTAFTPVTSVLRWTGRAANCGDCHNKASDNPADESFATWSKPHNKHANTYGNGGTIGSNNTTTNNTFVTCAACHASTAASNTALVAGTRAKHPNGFRNISASTTVGSAAFRWDAGNNQCKNGYCHSRAYSFTDYSTPWIKWNVIESPITCGSCHSSYPVGPDYANGYKAKANSHPKHAVFWGFTCDWCHNGTTTTGNTITNVRNHVNKNYNVVANGTKTFIGKANTFTATATTNPPTVKTTCSNVNCHGGNTSKVFTWGGTNKCGDCHFATTDTVNYAFQNSTMAVISRSEWRYSGHGKPSGTYDVTGATFAGFSSAAATAGGSGDPCLYCHEYDTVAHGDTVNPLRLRNFNSGVQTWGRNSVCLVCHASSGATGVTPGTGYTNKTATRKVDKYHYGNKHSLSLNAGQFCWDCHDSHGDRASSTDGRPIAMIHKKPTIVSDATTGAPTFFTVTTVKFVAKAAATDWAKTAAPFNGICNVCHTYKAADPNKMVHYTATNSDATHNTATVCTQCHLHSSTTTYDGTAYKGEPKVCDGCHDGNNNGGLSPGIAGTPATTAGHAIHYNQATVFNHYTGNNKHTATAYGFACKNCHVKTIVNHQNGGTAEMLGTIGYLQGGTLTPDGRNDYNYYNADTCGTNSCHQDGRLGTPQTTSFAWSGTRTSNCGKCHFDMSSSVSATGSHVKHAQSSGTAFACSTCHGTGYSSTAISNPTHVNNRLNLSFTGSAAGTTYQNGTSFPLNTAFGTCTASYCHSDVQGANGNGNGVPKTTPTWGNAAALACSACHTDMTASGSGTHLKHTASYACATCHSTAGSGTVKHADGFIDVTFSGAGAGSAYTQARTAAGSDGYGTCSNIACHYNGTATWGAGTLACVSCHPLATLQANGAHGKHISAAPTFYNYTANRSTVGVYDFGCSNCHPQDILLHANGSINVTLNATNTGGGGNVGSLRARNNATADGLAAGNGPSGIYGTTKVSVRCSAAYCHSNGYAANLQYMITPDWYGPAYTGDKCAMCHGNSPNANDPVNQSGSPAHYSKNFLGFANVSGGHLRGIHTSKIFTGSAGLAPAGNTTTGSHGNAGTSTTINCNICHNKTVTSSANDKNKSCISCHNALPKNPAELIADKRFHVSGNVDVAFASIRVKSKAQLRGVSYDATIWSRQVGYKAAGAYDDAFKTFTTATQWNGATKTCSNISCHNGKTVKWGDTGGTTSCVSCHSSL